ncbi:hypothetical protein FV232_01115 [Methylobacterium sp. WL30]|uniref:hypothetical protein n=1 Tax=unclassified Methylobacterium TaxID=2615210 RepID=UPI0011C869A3|nr:MULTISPECIES: hypothetical protein [unclassified Methylobacterium]TXN38740.1 hypothetical protein FV225_12615 [Methylobacterium sp. WL93]TXN52234.1 hypothetical protein FV227_04055 [Methylobacterium sp. WL119]TXN70683.1 hypothetical protein FV232_01115 [Methylobacterium sp. WL30]
MSTAPILRVLSLGAGVQSTTLALLAAHGEIGPMPDCAIFADTGWEPAAVMEHLRWLASGNVLPFPVHIVSAGNLRDDLLNRGSGRAGRFVTVPFFLRRTVPAGTVVPVFDTDGDGELVEVGQRTTTRGEHLDGIGRRQCTSHYKVEPIRRKVRELLGAGPRDPIPAGAVEKWIGISLDEVIRATPSKVRFEVNRHPLLELRMNRRDCLAWLDRNGYPRPPKSSCEGCPFHDQDQWREIMADPARRADVVEVDRAIRAPIDRPGVPAMQAEQFMHRQRVPLEDVDFSTAAERGQEEFGFLHECEGMCGV